MRPGQSLLMVESAIQNVTIFKKNVSWEIINYKMKQVVYHNLFKSLHILDRNLPLIINEESIYSRLIRLNRMYYYFFIKNKGYTYVNYMNHWNLYIEIYIFYINGGNDKMEYDIIIILSSTLIDISDINLYFLTKYFIKNDSWRI